MDLTVDLADRGGQFFCRGGDQLGVLKGIFGGRRDILRLRSHAAGGVREIARELRYALRSFDHGSDRSFRLPFDGIGHDLQGFQTVKASLFLRLQVLRLKAVDLLKV